MDAEDGDGDELLRRETFDLDTFQDVRASVRQWAVAAGADADQAESFTYAVNEGLINAITHGDGGGELTLRRAGGWQLVAVIEDRHPRPPFAVPTAPPPPSARGGRGLWLASELCHTVTVEEGYVGTRLILELGLRPEPAQKDD
jgi:anti-sigma regulatory factor (Ser/Thr protein kinase)